MQKFLLVPFLISLLLVLNVPARAVDVVTIPPLIPLDGIVTEIPYSGYDLPFVTSIPTASPDVVTLPDDVMDSAAVVDELSRTNTLLSYIFVTGLLAFTVVVGKLIYSFFNMFF